MTVLKVLLVLVIAASVTTRALGQEDPNEAYNRQMEAQRAEDAQRAEEAQRQADAQAQARADSEAQAQQQAAEEAHRAEDAQRAEEEKRQADAQAQAQADSEARDRENQFWADRDAQQRQAYYEEQDKIHQAFLARMQDAGSAAANPPPPLQGMPPPPGGMQGPPQLHPGPEQLKMIQQRQMQILQRQQQELILLQQRQPHPTPLQARMQQEALSRFTQTVQAFEQRQMAEAAQQPAGGQPAQPPRATTAKGPDGQKEQPSREEPQRQIAPTTQQQPKLAAPISDEDLAGVRLRLAQNYLNIKMADKGKEILNSLIEQYPKTHAAGTARQWLQSLQKGAGAPWLWNRSSAAVGAAR